MFFAGGLLVIVQVIFIIHAIRSGRGQQWLWFLLVVPGISSLVYFLTEVLPDIRSTRQYADISSFLTRRYKLTQTIRNMENELAVQASPDNRRRLALECLAAGDHRRACDLLTDLARGFYREDRAVAMNLAICHYHLGDYASARARLDWCAARSPLEGTDECLLDLLVRTAQAPEQAEDLEVLYRKTRSLKVGYHAIRLLYNNNSIEKATAILADMKQQLLAHRDLRRTMGADWYRLARRLKPSQPVRPA